MKKERNIIFEASPTIKPSVLLLTLVVVFMGGVIRELAMSPVEVAGLSRVNELLMSVIGILSIIISIRILIRVIILRRTKYIIRTDSLERKTDLIFRYKSRKAPINELRGFEYSQNTIQRLLGYGSIRLLTGGTNQSLGFLVFENLPHAGKARNHIEDLIE
jgi:uncharacterized membrane protein YdbT with pleckstrin-like domain